MAEITDIPKHKNLEAFMLKHGKAGETFISIKETNYLCARSEEHTSELQSH